MLNNSKIYRSGCPSRVIFYSQSSKGHEYNYGKPVLSITGRNSRHIVQNSSVERKLFSNIKPHPLPNSKRTINPNYGNPQIQKFNKAKKYQWEKSSIEYSLCESQNKKFKPTIKISDKNNKTSEELKQDFNNKNKECMNKNSYSFYIKNKYDYNSEILNLPGGSKRIDNDINDDFYKNKNITEKRSLNTTANCFRERDFNNSKISCLQPFLKSKNQNIRKNIIALANKDYVNDYSEKDNLINNMTNAENKECYNDNKYKYNKRRAIKRNIFESSKEDNENNFNTDKFNNFQRIGVFKNYINDSFSNKSNDLITRYSRKRNMNSYNKLFNDIHQENSKYNLMKYYGKNYAKKNYTQFELN